MNTDVALSGPANALRLAIDVEALRGNWRALDQLSGTARAGAAVKANGYGLGSRRVVGELLSAGCRDLFVAHPLEASELVDLVDPAMLSVLHGPLLAADAGWMRAKGVRPVINSLRQARLWLDVGGGPCYLMVDTGINRLGLPMSQLVIPPSGFSISTCCSRISLRRRKPRRSTHGSYRAGRMREL